MKKLVLSGLAALLLACAGCGVSTQDRPEKLPSLTRMPDPTPSVTQVPEHAPTSGSSGSRQVPPGESTTG